MHAEIATQRQAMQVITDMAHELLSNLSLRDHQQDEALTKFHTTVTNMGLAVLRDVDERVQRKVQEILDDIEKGFEGVKRSLSTQVCGLLTECRILTSSCPMS
jgi:hypothetical protein